MTDATSDAETSQVECLICGEECAHYQKLLDHVDYYHPATQVYDELSKQGGD